MASKVGKYILCVSRILDEIKKNLDSRKFDWDCISKPLQEDPNERGNIHNPTIEEYRMIYSVDGKLKTKYN